MSAHAQKKSVPGYAWLHTNVTEVGSRLRTVTQKRNQGRFPVTLGYTNALPTQVSGYGLSHKNVKRLVLEKKAVKIKKRNKGSEHLVLTRKGTCTLLSGFSVLKEY